MRTRPIFKLYARLDHTIIATTEDLAHTCCVAATTYVFQQKRVIEVGQRNRGKAEFHPEAHAKQAAAQRMPRDGTLGEIQRKG